MFFVKMHMKRENQCLFCTVSTVFEIVIEILQRASYTVAVRAFSSQAGTLPQENDTAEK